MTTNTDGDGTGTPSPLSFSMPTRVLSGLGSLAALPQEIHRLGGRRVAVVADQGVAAVGLLQRILDPLDPTILYTTILVGPDPDVTTAERAAETARAARCDLVLAIGGGSALGAAKAVAIRLTNVARIDEYEGLDRAPNLPAPTIAIPTTAGSGSEVSRVLVLHEPGRDTELIVRLQGEEPRVAILDATVLRGLPRTAMIHAGLDALSHCFESLWARKSTPFTAALAGSAAGIILENLPRAVIGVGNGASADGANDAVLQRLLEASCAANMACGNSGLTLVHALSGAPTVHLPHGQQNGILLPHVARFNDEVVGSAERVLAAALPKLYADIDFEPTFAGQPLPSSTAASMLRASADHPFRVNNRRPSTDAQICKLLAAAGVPE